MTSTHPRHDIVLKFYCDLEPVDRYRRYHLPLDTDLTAKGLGEVTGGGTMEDLETGEVLFCDVQISVHDDLDRAMGVIRTVLSRCGAPPGTELCVDGSDTVIRIDVH